MSETATSPKQITLAEWARSVFGQVPHATTLRRWAREGYINPQPQLVGRNYLVPSTAVYVGKTK